MSYPQIVEYNAAVQDPRNTFTDPELRAGRVAETNLGLPLALSGGFALTYTVQSGSKKFAVRCFHREVPQAQNRYAKISAKLRSLASPYFVNFEFQPQGIRVQRSHYPVVKMDWAEGETLGVYLDRVASNSGSVAALRQSFAALAEYLERNSIAHGDIQNENVIVTKGGLRLIDYDGMFVVGLTEGQGTEVGHKHFQHPERRTQHFGPKIDRFSFLVIDTSLEAVQADPSLYRKFREGGQAIIFKANDFADPASSEVFRALGGMPALRSSAAKLAAVCGAPLTSAPTLADFKNGINIPAAVITRPTGASPKVAVVQAYIGAFPTIDAKDFDAVLRLVGHKIELVGKVVSVKEGVGKRGRGKGLPYVFINFGVWNKESVKITIWSEGLGNMSTRPTEAWVGKWISVTGLVEPPYEGKHYGRPYRSVGVTVDSDNQIIHLAERDAKFRLAGNRTQPQSKPKNAAILDEIFSGSPTGRAGTVTSSRPTAPPASPPLAAQTPPAAAKTKNEEILRQLQMAGSTMAQPNASHQNVPSAPTPIAEMLSRIPPWVWIGGGFLLLLALLRGR